MGGKRRKLAGKPPAKGAGAGARPRNPGPGSGSGGPGKGKNKGKGGAAPGAGSGSKATTTTTTAAAAAGTNPKKTDAPTAATLPEPTIPFAPEDRILLVGDGDLSFAASLVDHHYCADVTATVLERSPEELAEKYPQAAANAARVEAEDGCRVLYGVDATTMKPFAAGRKRRRKNDGGKDDSGKDDSGKKGSDPEHHHQHDRRGQRGNENNEDDNDDTHRGGGNGNGDGLMDRIIFNFPHVGGKSTDVNRQVRYNQELLVSFFRRALPSLAPRGSVVVTLFEGEPYTLWNVRDLARHAGGLRVDRSFRFRADAYPGYHHARTLGVVRTRSGGVSATGWKGEDRPSRSYVFVRKDDTPPPRQPGAGAKRRRGRDSDSDDDD